MNFEVDGHDVLTIKRDHRLCYLLHLLGQLTKTSDKVKDFVLENFDQQDVIVLMVPKDGKSKVRLTWFDPNKDFITLA